MVSSYKKKSVKQFHLSRLACLKYLDVARSKEVYTQFPISICAIESLTSLKILTPYSCMTSSIPNETYCKIPKEIEQLKNLTELTIDNQNFNIYGYDILYRSTNIPSYATFTLHNLSKITSLNFTCVKIYNNDFKCLVKLYELKSLSLQECSIENWEINLACIIQYLKHLSLKNQSSNSRPNSQAFQTDLENLLYKATNLTSLTISRCGLHVVPKSIKQLKSLQYLDISNNVLSNIEEIDNISTQLTNLTYFKHANYQSN